ncbi:hypothetical protein RF55_26597, partial [Lasius niger]
LHGMVNPLCKFLRRENSNILRRIIEAGPIQGQGKRFPIHPDQVPAPIRTISDPPRSRKTDHKGDISMVGHGF